MGEVRTFQESHIPEVADLQLKVIRGESRPAGPGLRQYFKTLFLENPWRDEDITSLVYIHQGEVVGFLGVIPRPMVWNGSPIKAAITTQFMVDRSRFRGAAGIELLQQFFRGPQDFSLTDGARETSYITWTSMGGTAAWLYSLEWTRLLQPARYVRNVLKQRRGMWRPLANAMLPAAILSDIVLAHTPIRGLTPPVSKYECVPVGPAELLRAIEAFGWNEKLHPLYHLESFTWLLEQTAQATSHGTLKHSIVNDSEGRCRGWFVYFSRPGGTAMVLQIGATPRHIDQVLLALFEDARLNKAVAVRGRAIPRYLTQFNYQHCSFQHIGSGVLVHSRHPDLLSCVLRGDAFLSLLDGEWWLRFGEQWD